VTKALVGLDYMYEQDITLERFAWNDSIEGKEKLRVCFIDTVENYPPAKSVQNGLRLVCEKLEMAGHYVERIPVETWKDPSWQDLLVNNKYITCHMARNQRETLNKNILSGEVIGMSLLINTPQWLAKVACWALANVLGRKTEAFQLEVASTLLSSNQYMKKIGFLELFRSKVGTTMTNGDFDALLLPGGMMPAYPKGNGFNLTHLQTISMLPN
jgi:hypothetical protein